MYSQIPNSRSLTWAGKVLNLCPLNHSTGCHCQRADNTMDNKTVNSWSYANSSKTIKKKTSPPWNAIEQHSHTTKNEFWWLVIALTLTFTGWRPPRLLFNFLYSYNFNKRFPHVTLLQAIFWCSQHFISVFTELQRWVNTKAKRFC